MTDVIEVEGKKTNENVQFTIYIDILVTSQYFVMAFNVMLSINKNSENINEMEKLFVFFCKITIKF